VAALIVAKQIQLSRETSAAWESWILQTIPRILHAAAAFQGDHSSGAWAAVIDVGLNL